MSTPGTALQPELLFELARGGMGAVHLARIVGLGGFERFVVVKRILDTTQTETEVVERFLSEARIAATIHHANVVGTHHVGTDESGLYMVLDYVEGGSLAALTDRAMLRGERMPIPIVLRIALDALAGLGAVHRAMGSDGTPLGVVHRDVSLQNILVGRDGVARLTDFGIARSARPSIKTKTGSLIGKLLYLPPEHIRQEPTDHTIDIYMLGVTLWCALTGEEPWPGSDEAQLMHRILTEPLPSVASRRGEPVAPEIERLVSTAAHPVASERYQSAAQMAQVIEVLGRDRGWVASQHEVATFVEGLLGVDLNRRRERITQISVQGSAQPSIGSRSAVAEPGTATPLAPRKTQRLAWAVAAAVLVTAAVILSWPTRERTTQAQPAAELGTATTTPITADRRARPPALSASANADAPPLSATSNTAAATATATTSVDPRREPSVAQAPQLPVQKEPRTSTQSKSAASQVPAAKTATPASAPNDISPRNPYR
ncbi:MAG TPA: serine/threonine-protein kinase [Polyangiaceae bacterium]|nr:serine/threonine-protein kinase [Polyangiaceae bacterium]